MLALSKMRQIAPSGLTNPMAMTTAQDMVIMATPAQEELIIWTMMSSLNSDTQHTSHVLPYNREIVVTH